MSPNSKSGRPWNLSCQTLILWGFQLEPPWFPWKGRRVEHQTATAQQRHLGEGLGCCWSFYGQELLEIEISINQTPWRCLSTKTAGDFLSNQNCNFLSSFDSLLPGFPRRGAALPSVAPIFSAGDWAAGKPPGGKGVHLNRDQERRTGHTW